MNVSIRKTAVKRKLPPAPKSVMVNSREELYQSYLEAKQQIAEGKCIPFDVAMARLEEKYEFLR